MVREKSALPKQLRLDVAQLTDVGRKREHNEDNMAYVIPKDSQVMTRKGALFIVADGMGGHAAGEVASEIAVDTVSNLYYQDDSEDVAASLVYAIKRANAAIHQRAAENMLRSGMGTTCVAAVLRGNMAFIANVGDSRAYIIRGGEVKQVSQDHSWVAEQVRAGLLTEDQARTHAQRNVITRCLGTQADVDIDVFSEQLQEGDSLVLCTDGLSGLISDDDLQKIVNQFIPQESVYHLVERANENGGPDNITAIVVHVKEVGAEVPNGRHPAYVGARETSEDARTTGSLTTVPLAFAPRASAIRSGPLRVSSGPLVSPDSDTAPQPVIKVPRRSRSRLFYPTLALLILMLMGIVGAGAYYLFRPSGPDVAQALQQAQRLIAQANNEVSSNPASALGHLASAQKTLQGVQNRPLTDAQRTQSRHLLQNELPGTVKVAIRSYNQRSAITPLPCPSVSASATINDVSTGTHAQRLAAVQDGTGAALLYAAGQDRKLYALKQQKSLVGSLTLPATLQVVDIAGDDTRLAVLLKGSAPESYSLGLLLPGQQKLTTQAPLDPAWLVNGQLLPIRVVAQGSDIYVVLASAPAANTAQMAQIVDFTVDARNTLKASPLRSHLSLSANLVSVAAFPGRVLFLLLATGAVQSLQVPAPSPLPTPTPSPTTVLLQSPIAPSLAVSATDFTPTTPVPTVATPGASTGPTPLVTANQGVLAAGLVGGEPHLYLADTANDRLLDLKLVGTAASGGGVAGNRNLTMQVVQQYVSSSLLTQMKSITMHAKSMQVYILTQNALSMFSLVSINTGVQAQSSCA